MPHYDSLLDAELDSLRGGTYSAGRSYEASILYAGRRGLTPDQALAHERYGEHWVRLGPNHVHDAQFQLGEAVKLYDEWGAHAKVEQIRSDYDSILSLPTGFVAVPGTVSGLE